MGTTEPRSAWQNTTMPTPRYDGLRHDWPSPTPDICSRRATGSAVVAKRFGRAVSVVQLRGTDRSTCTVAWPCSCVECIHGHGNGICHLCQTGTTKRATNTPPLQERTRGQATAAICVDSWCRHHNPTQTLREHSGSSQLISSQHSI